MDLKRGIDKAVAKVVESIKSQAEMVGDNYDKIEQVAAVSANNDSSIRSFSFFDSNVIIEKKFGAPHITRMA